MIECVRLLTAASERRASPGRLVVVAALLDESHSLSVGLGRTYVRPVLWRSTVSEK